MSTDELSPGSTGLTTKEVLLEVRQDVKDTRQAINDLTSSVGILTSQNLDVRLNHIESWKDKVDGRVTVLIVLVSVVGGLLGIGLTVVTLLRVLFPPV